MGVANGVGDEIGDDPFQQQRIADHETSLSWGREVKTFLVRQRFYACGDTLQDRLQVKFANGWFEYACV